MAMFVGYLEISVNFNKDSRREKILKLISILRPIYCTYILIRSWNVLCFLRELLMSFLMVLTNWYFWYSG